PVRGLDFSTPSLSGVTDAAGSFSFLPGESVTFSIGRLVLGSGAGATVMSPFSLAGSSDINNNTVTNLAVLLQSLDVDNGPDIRIADIAAGVAPASLDFAQTPASFAADPAVLAFIRAATGDNSRNPVSPAQARAHLLQALGQDDDNDGVPNTTDACPNTPAGTVVNAQGCPLGTGNNLAPSADAGADQFVDEAATVSLTGSGTDSDGSIASRAWTQTGGPSVTLSGADTDTPSFTAPAVDDETNLVFRFTVTDNNGATASDSVGVVVRNAQALNVTGLAGVCLDMGGPAPLCGLFGTIETAPPDRIVLASNQTPRGDLVIAPAEPDASSPKIVDGGAVEWQGAPTGIGGSARLDKGEHIYTDYLFDAYGADDGTDAQRLEVLDPLAEFVTRSYRVDQLFQAAGDQFGAPPPIGALDHYGDATTLDDQADLYELRWAAQGDSVYLLARFSTLTEADKSGLLILLDTVAGPAAATDIGFGSGLSTQRFDQAILLTADGAQLRDLATGTVSELDTAEVAIAPGADAAGARWNNTLEARLPAALFNAVGATRLAVIAGPRSAEGITPANVAYRFDEPVAGVYNDKQQALALLAGNVDGFTASISIRNLARGSSESFAIGPGYHERQFVSGENISRESGENGLMQRYGLYVPSNPVRNVANQTPLTFWLHYRGGKAHSGAAWTPRLITQLGEEQGNIVATPHARGTSTWYVTESHQDFFEVFADLAGTAIAGNENLSAPVDVPPLLSIDPDRVYLSGYSMGGYATYVFGLLYPDLFAAGYPTSGAVTQGAWTGIGPDDDFCSSGQQDIPEVGEGNPCFVETNNGNANAQLNYRILENARHFPIVIHHGSNDELALTPGAERMGLRLLELGYRYDMTTFLGYEHFTQAIVDEWAD
ncbi:MAG: PKD domain-containing protein, partial [Nevskiales bacterium]